MQIEDMMTKQKNEQLFDYFKTNASERLKKPYVSEDYTEKDKQNLFSGLQLAIEYSQSQKISQQHIISIFRAMFPELQETMKTDVRTTCVAFHLSHESVTPDGLAELLNWIEKNPAGYGPKFYLGNQLFSQVSECREHFSCSNNSSLAVQLIKEMSRTNNKIVYLPPYDSINPYEDHKTLTEQQRIELNKMAYQLSKNKVRDGVSKKFNQFINEFNQIGKKPSLEQIVGFVKDMILVHPFHNGNGRTFTLGVLNCLLIKYQYGVCINLNPNLIAGHSNAQFVAELKKSIVSLNRIVDHCDLLDEVPESHDQLIVEDTAIQTLYASSREMQRLIQSIEQMKQYGHKLKSKEIDKGEMAIILADGLVDILQQHSKLLSNPGKNEEQYKKFEDQFLEKLNSQYDALAEHRAFKNVIIANVLIALTGVGALFLAAQAIYSYHTTGKAVGFFNKTTGQQCADEIKAALTKNTLAIECAM